MADLDTKAQTARIAAGREQRGMDARLADDLEPAWTLVSCDDPIQGSGVSVEDRLAHIEAQAARVLARQEDVLRRLDELEYELYGGGGKIGLRSDVELLKTRMADAEFRAVKHKDGSIRIMIAVIAAISAIISGAIGILDHWFRGK